MSPVPGFGEAERFLMKAHPGLGAVIRRVGPCALAPRPPSGPPGHYLALVRAIVSQQLSGKAADTIFGRVAALGEGRATTEPEVLLTLPDEALRGAGLSRSKAASLRDLATRATTGALRLAEIERLDEEEVIAHLTTVRGVGRWTAEMFLMFRLLRPDVFPKDDLGVKKGIVRLFGLRKMPDGARLERLAEPFRPHRSVFAWYLWRLVDGAIPEDELGRLLAPKNRAAPRGALKNPQGAPRARAK